MKVLITAGPVSGPLDDNKKVTNKARGLWAARFVEDLVFSQSKDVQVIYLVEEGMHVPSALEAQRAVTLVRHNGFWDYQEKCVSLAKEVDVVLLAAAVTNWIPQTPVKGKMLTKGFKPGDVTHIPFVLAPRVIDQIRAVNPSVFLIGFKLTCGLETEETVSLAYQTLLGGRCNVVIANDRSDLRTKFLVFPDRSVHRTHVSDLSAAVLKLLRDVRDTCPPAVVGEEHEQPSAMHVASAMNVYRDLSVYYPGNTCPERGDHTFGATCVPILEGGYLVSPREKTLSQNHPVFVGADGAYQGPRKPTLNAKLLMRLALEWGSAVVHQHIFLADVPTLPYAPPGTKRDTLRDIPAGCRAFNIEGHGCFFAVSHGV